MKMQSEIADLPKFLLLKTLCFRETDPRCVALFDIINDFSLGETGIDETDPSRVLESRVI